MDDTKILQRELWDLMMQDNGHEVEELRSLKKREDRRGRVKRMLCKAIDRSSLGLFNGLLHHFDGKVYIPIGVRAFKKVLYDILSLRIELPDADLAKLGDIYDDCINSVYSHPLSADSNIMVFRNGVLEVDKGEFHRTFNKKYVQMWSVDYDYNPNAKTFLWYQFLNQVLPDKYLQEVLQMFLGATFIDRHKVKIENIIILLGKGANGKSVIQKAVCGVLGENCVGTQDIGRLCSRGVDGDESVALINGKRLNYCTEMETTDFYKKSARLKAIVSGEKVPARFRYGIGFDAMNLPLLMANANQIPFFNKKDDALVRRIYVIPFEVTIPVEKQNRTLNDELVEEYPGILNWILEGRDKFIEKGYKLPDDINADRFLKDVDGDFCFPLKYMNKMGYRPRLEGVDILPLNWIKLTTLHSGYERWCRAQGIETIGKKGFAYALETEGGYQKKRFADGNKFAVYGEITVNTLKRESAKLRKAKDDRPKVTLMWVDGTAWVTSQQSLASYSGISLAVVRRLCHEGLFDPYTKAYREKLIYDVKSCCRVMREKRVIATDEEKEINSRILLELKYLRNMFNQRMEYNNLPYRKYGSEFEQIDDSIIVVPDETSDDEVYEMALKAGYDLSKWSKYRRQGMFSKGGKGFFASRDDIPDEREREIYENATK